MVVKCVVQQVLCETGKGVKRNYCGNQGAKTNVMEKYFGLRAGRKIFLKSE